MALLLVPIYLLLLNEASDHGVTPASLPDTPPSGTASAIGLDAGKLAPNFEISTPEGKRQSLAQLRGRPVLINF